MFIISGKRLCGRVDQVRGACYVATRFFHLYYVPLIPLSSWVIVQGTEKSSGFRGQQIPLSGKSVVFGWLQAFLIVFGVIDFVWGAILLACQHRAADNGFDGSVRLALGLSCLMTWLLFTIRPFQAGQARAEELMTLLDVGGKIGGAKFIDNAERKSPGFSRKIPAASSRHRSFRST